MKSQHRQLEIFQRDGRDRVEYKGRNIIRWWLKGLWYLDGEFGFDTLRQAKRAVDKPERKAAK